MKPEQIVETFDECFLAWNTRLVGGATEPLYQPGAQESLIYFREDFASSALHEVAHWCIAGKRRREQMDYGYWYHGERDAQLQRTFESVEVKPQALEWIFSRAAGIDFRVSCDNFDESTLNMTAFRQAVQSATRVWLESCPPRAASFIDALINKTGNHEALMTETYQALPA